jgi:hypothetical protein
MPATAGRQKLQPPAIAGLNVAVAGTVNLGRLEHPKQALRAVTHAVDLSPELESNTLPASLHLVQSQITAAYTRSRTRFARVSTLAAGAVDSHGTAILGTQDCPVGSCKHTGDPRIVCQYAARHSTDTSTLWPT